MKFRLSDFLLIGNTIQFLLIYKKNKIIEDLKDQKILFQKLIVIELLINKQIIDKQK